MPKAGDWVKAHPNNQAVCYCSGCRGKRAQARVKANLEASKQARRSCDLCSEHYGKRGPCDEGKPLASPHRKRG